MQGLIGSTGLIGTHLQQQIHFDCVYSSATINSICNREFDTLWITAPSSNRLAAAKYPDKDTAAVDQIIRCLNTVNAKRIILISTVDTVHAPDTVYGHNRLRLEQSVKNKDAYIVRLCTLIHNNIKKNLLFDLRNRQYLDSIKQDTARQWYPLCNLTQDVEQAIGNSLREVNLVSPPITDGEIIQRYFPSLTILPGKTDTYDINPYTVTQEQVFAAMDEYFA